MHEGILPRLSRPQRVSTTWDAVHVTDDATGSRRQDSAGFAIRSPRRRGDPEITTGIKVSE